MTKTFLMALLVSVVCFTACSKDEKDKKDKKDKDSLVGTSWLLTEEYTDEGAHLVAKRIVKILDDSKAEMGYTILDSVGNKVNEFHNSGTYSYSAPTIKISFVDLEEGNYTEEGIIDGNKMIFTVEGYESIYIKQ